jgi:hypothetical protein
LKYNAPYGVSDPNAAYINGDPSVGLMGSIPPAASIEYPQREIVEVIADSGFTPDNADLKQLAKSIQLQRVNFGIDAGTVNNLQVTLAPVPVYKNGLVVRVLAVQSNTGPSVLNVNAIGPKKIRRPGDTDLLANDITAGGTVTLVYNETLQGGAGAWELQGAQASQSGAGGYMTKNMDLYVNWNVGNDANDGTANDTTHAFKTIQHAIDMAWNYRPSQYTLTIHIADSQFYTAFQTPFWAGPNLQIIGNEAAPAGVLVSGISASNGGPPFRHACTIGGNQSVIVAGIKVAIASTDSGHQGCGFWVGNGAVVQIRNCEGGFCDGYHVFAGYGGNVSILTSYRISGGSFGQILNCSGGAKMTTGICSFNITAPVSAAVFMNSAMGYSQFSSGAGNTNFVNPGNFTGQKYGAQLNAVIDTGGGGVNFFPGTIAGTTQTGGQYT